MTRNSETRITNPCLADHIQESRNLAENERSLAVAQFFRTLKSGLEKAANSFAIFGAKLSD